MAREHARERPRATAVPQPTGEKVEEAKRLQRREREELKGEGEQEPEVIALGDKEDTPFDKKGGAGASKEEVFAIRYDTQQNKRGRERSEANQDYERVENELETGAGKQSGLNREEGSEEEEAWGSWEKLEEKHRRKKPSTVATAGRRREGSKGRNERDNEKGLSKTNPRRRNGAKEFKSEGELERQRVSRAIRVSTLRRELRRRMRRRHPQQLVAQQGFSGSETELPSKNAIHTTESATPMAQGMTNAFLFGARPGERVASKDIEIRATPKQVASQEIAVAHATEGRASSTTALTQTD